MNSIPYRLLTSEGNISCTYSLLHPSEKIFLLKIFLQSVSISPTHPLPFPSLNTHDLCPLADSSGVPWLVPPIHFS